MMDTLAEPAAPPTGTFLSSRAPVFFFFFFAAAERDALPLADIAPPRLGCDYAFSIIRPPRKTTCIRCRAYRHPEAIAVARVVAL